MSQAPLEDFRAVFEAAPDGILLVDDEGRILEANRRLHLLFGYPEGSLVGEGVELLVPIAKRGAHEHHRRRYHGAPGLRPMGSGMELTGVRRDGSEIPIEISLSPLGSTGDGRVIAVVRDLTERLRLRGFGAAQLRGAEEERRRLSRELHDDTAQALSALLLQFRLLERGLPAAYAEESARFRSGLHATAEGVRRMARGLRPPELEDLGLGPAIASFLRERYPHAGVRVEMDGSESELGIEAGLAAYRIVQEAVGNALRYAGARTIGVRIGRVEGGWIAVEVSDDGSGFERDHLPDPGAGLGLVGMEERATLVGGQLEIESKRGEGTRVRAVLPRGREGAHD